MDLRVGLLLQHRVIQLEPALARRAESDSRKGLLMAGNTVTSFGQAAVEKNRGTYFKQINAALDCLADRRAPRRCAQGRNGVRGNDLLLPDLGIRNAAFRKQTRQG